MPVIDRPRPRRHAEHAATSSVSDHDPTDRLHDRQQRPLCELHAIRLVHKLPAQCVFSVPNPLTAIEQLRAIGWGALGGGLGNPDLPDALEVLNQADVCLDCVWRLSGHPTIERLRREAGVTQ